MKFFTYAALHREIVDLATRVPGDVRGIIGIPRSGMMAASILSLHLHLPLVSIDEWVRTASFYGAGRRLAALPPTAGRLLLVDDTMWSGAAMRAALAQIPAADDVLTAAVYINSAGPTPDIHGVAVEGPRLFEWNVWNHSLMAECLVDLDGVLCPDPEKDDDGPIYERFISSAPRRYRPRRVAGIVTCRLEKWRPQTEAWLAATGIEYGSLTMMQYPTARARRAAGQYGAYKAAVYAAHPAAPLFVESSARQAEAIVNITGRSVLCTDRMRLITTTETP
jgi:uncharacterized HAD superfamily protein/hypoxanthine phosphoribosyltransferase